MPPKPHVAIASLIVIGLSVSVVLGAGGPKGLRRSMSARPRGAATDVTRREDIATGSMRLPPDWCPGIEEPEPAWSSSKSSSGTKFIIKRTWYALKRKLQKNKSNRDQDVAEVMPDPVPARHSYCPTSSARDHAPLTTDPVPARHSYSSTSSTRDPAPHTPNLVPARHSLHSTLPTRDPAPITPDTVPARRTRRSTLQTRNPAPVMSDPVSARQPHPSKLSTGEPELLKDKDERSQDSGSVSDVHSLTDESDVHSLSGETPKADHRGPQTANERGAWVPHPDPVSINTLEPTSAISSMPMSALQDHQQPQYSQQQQQPQYSQQQQQLYIQQQPYTQQQQPPYSHQHSNDDRDDGGYPRKPWIDDNGNVKPDAWGDTRVKYSDDDDSGTSLICDHFYASEYPLHEAYSESRDHQGHL